MVADAPIVRRAGSESARAIAGRARRILLVDDLVLVRTGLRLTLAHTLEAPEFEEVGSYREARESLERSSFDLVLLDCCLPDYSGPETLSELVALAKDTPVVVVGREWSSELINATLPLGVRGFIPQKSTVELMLAALGVVFSGAVYVPPDALLSLGRQATTLRLSERQRKVLQLVVDGCTNKEIASRLDVSVSTVRVHLQAIFRTLNACNRTQACQVALRLQLVQA